MYLCISSKVRRLILNLGICYHCLLPDLGGLLVFWKGLNCWQSGFFNMQL